MKKNVFNPQHATLQDIIKLGLENISQVTPQYWVYLGSEYDVFDNYKVVITKKEKAVC